MAKSKNKQKTHVGGAGINEYDKPGVYVGPIENFGTTIPKHISFDLIIGEESNETLTIYSDDDPEEYRALIEKFGAKIPKQINNIDLPDLMKRNMFEYNHQFHLQNKARMEEAMKDYNEHHHRTITLFANMNGHKEMNDELWVEYHLKYGE